MKRLARSVSLLMALAITVSVLFACGPEEPTADSESISTIETTQSVTETAVPPVEVINPSLLDYPPAADRTYTVTTPETLEYGAQGLSITVKAAEPGVSLTPHRNYRIVKLAGPANGKDAEIGRASCRERVCCAV